MSKVNDAIAQKDIQIALTGFHQNPDMQVWKERKAKFANDGLADKGANENRVKPHAIMALCMPVLILCGWLQWMAASINSIDENRYTEYGVIVEDESQDESPVIATVTPRVMGVVVPSPTPQVIRQVVESIPPTRQRATGGQTQISIHRSKSK